MIAGAGFFDKLQTPVTRRLQPVEKGHRKVPFDTADDASDLPCMLSHALRHGSPALWEY